MLPGSPQWYLPMATAQAVGMAGTLEVAAGQAAKMPPGMDLGLHADALRVRSALAATATPTSVVATLAKPAATESTSPTA